MPTDCPPASIRRIAIVGGGTSGWMAAALLARVLPQGESTITVIEPQQSPGIGVGEATIPSLHRLLQTLQANEADMMRACSATWKIGIQFADWVTPERDYWHPFGVCGARIDERDLFSYWLAEKTRSGLQRPYHSYSLHWAASLAGKSPHSYSGRSPIAATQSYAFHLNADAFAGWLKTRAMAGGVLEQTGTVGGACRNDAGDVTAVTLESGESVTADFFIDCSGFASVLMHQTLDDPFIDGGSQLLCDRAVAIRVPGGRMIPTHTLSQAMPAGWAWRIPLEQQTGFGYVYSSQFVSDDDAWQQLQQLAGGTAIDKATPRFLKMRVGRQTNVWRHNVLALGLAAGFVEPLESTGLHLTQVGIERFIELFPRGRQTSPLRDQYNARMAAIFDEVRDFVQLHYSLSQRDDHPFWTAAREAPISTALEHRLALYDEAGIIDPLLPEAFPESSYYFLLTGNGRYPRRPAPLAMSVHPEQIQDILNTIRKQNEDALRDLPLHEDMLQRLHTPPLAQAS